MHIFISKIPDLKLYLFQKFLQLSKELVQTRQELKDALSNRVKMEEDVRRLQEALQAATTDKVSAT